MNTDLRKVRRVVVTLLFALFAAAAVRAQQPGASLRGQVLDEFGGAIVGATVTLTGAAGPKVATTNGDGVYAFTDLAPGRYALRVEAKGFAASDEAEVSVAAGRRETHDVRLTVRLTDEQVTVAAGGRDVGTDPENNASAIVLRETELNALSDDPDQFADDLRALAGAGDGPNGTQFFVDGFSQGRVPSKSSIREVRINANPFAAESESLGFGRIEIFTKPGAEQFHGQGFFNFNDESMNARNAFAPRRAPFQSRLFGGSLSGPITVKKSSFFLDFERRDIDENAVINATVLDGFGGITPFRQVIITPQRRTNFSARFDYQLNKNNTLVARYNYLRSSFDNSGIGGFSLPTRAFDLTRSENILQLTETAILSPSILNETRFQFIRGRRRQEGDASLPVIAVQEAFIGGGAPFGLALNDSDRFELQNVTTGVRGLHTWKAGGRLRALRITDVAPSNFNGTFVFSSLEQYQQVLAGTPGVRPAQFTIAGGNPRAEVTQYDLAGFAQDDWRMTPNFTLSYGLRFETQNNINDRVDIAPRVAFAWAPVISSKTKKPQTVIRAGIGLFYFRVEDGLTLDLNRFNGVNQQQFIVPNPDFFPNIPTAGQLAAAAVPQTVRRIDPALKTPYSIRAAVSLEQKWAARNTTLAVTYIYERDLQSLRSRNINAPLPGTFNPAVPGSGVRPFGNVGNIFQFEGGGLDTDNTVFINLTTEPTKRISVFSLNGLSRETNDTEGPYDFPANSYDLAAEYGRASFDVRAFTTTGANIQLPWGGLVLASFVRASTPGRFNITTGLDNNGDAIFNDRPAFATDLSRPGVVVTPIGAFDTDPLPGQPIIPRNYGKAASLFQVNMRLIKTFRFNLGGGSSNKAAPAAPAAQGTAARPAAPAAEKRYRLTLTLQAQNLFNHVNRGTIIGNLSSPLFGQANSLGGIPRRVDVQMRLSF
jgi:hypothetical protein